jgi:hypothetical protein
VKNYTQILPAMLSQPVSILSETVQLVFVHNAVKVYSRALLRPHTGSTSAKGATRCRLSAPRCAAVRGLTEMHVSFSGVAMPFDVWFAEAEEVGPFSDAAALWVAL